MTENPVLMVAFFAGHPIASFGTRGMLSMPPIRALNQEMPLKLIAGFSIVHFSKSRFYGSLRC